MQGVLNLLRVEQGERKQFFRRGDGQLFVLFREMCIRDRPGDVTGIVRGKEGRQGGDIFHGTLFFQRYFLNEFFLEIVGNGIGHFRGDEAGSNGVARDFARSEFLSQ